jgi:hypothetical protein
LKVIQIGIDDLDDMLALPTRNLLLFSLDVCAPCEWIKQFFIQVGPELESVDTCAILTLTYGQNHEDQRLGELGVRHFPTLIMYENGELLGVLRGAITKSGPLNEVRLLDWLGRTGGERLKVSAPGL